MVLILKLFIKEEKLIFFITNLRAFCIHFLQTLSPESAGNTLRFRGKKQYIFQTKFFPLEFEGISYNSEPLTMHHILMNLVITTLFKKYLDPQLKMSIFESVLKSCVYNVNSTYPYIPGKALFAMVNQNVFFFFSS